MIKRLLVRLLPVSLIQNVENRLLKHYKMSKNLLAYSDPDLMEKISEKKAMYMFKMAAQKIPAYQNFLSENEVKVKKIKSISDFNKVLPSTTKSNYIKKNKFESLCVGGQLPKTGIIEESSGSSGHPTDWVKSFSEDTLLEKEVEFESEYLFGLADSKSIIISCWSQGPWTTDLKFCEFFEHIGIVKNTGPDIDGIVEIIKKFGPEYHYLIGGYPPFCRILFEKTRRKINWRNYNVDLVVGGEGFVIGWRDHIKKLINPQTRVFSCYGASDIDIGVAFETPLSIFIRDSMIRRKELNEALGYNGRFPMIFQYNPLAHYIDNLDGEKKEFTITPLDPTVAAPKIKYNLHDEGGKWKFNDMMKLLNETICDDLENFKRTNKKAILHLPFLLVYGRSDGTISINGTNVYPQQVEISLMKNPTLANKIHTFRIGSGGQNRRFTVKIELKEKIVPNAKLRNKYTASLVKFLPEVSEEFKQALVEFPKQFHPKVLLYKYGTGPFRSSKPKIKHTYIE